MSPVFGFFDFDVKKAETGIIYIDEVDKIARKADNPSIARDVLNILLVCGGAFADLDKVIERRIGHKGVGFGAHVSSKHNKDTGAPFEKVRPEDLVRG